MAKIRQTSIPDEQAQPKLGRTAFAMKFPEVVLSESSLLLSPGDKGEEETFYQYLKKRESIYRMLGRVYKNEVDSRFIKELGSFPFPINSENSELARGSCQLASFIKEGQFNLEDLMADYAQVFLGNGIANHRIAIPYESVYTSPDGRLMHDAFEKVLRIFYAQGFSSDLSNIHSDQIGLELEFMGYLCHKSQKAIEKNSPTSLSKTLSDQKKFLETHLLNWVPEFLVDVREYSESPFYQSAALMTSGFLQLEKEQFAVC